MKVIRYLVISRRFQKRARGGYKAPCITEIQWKKEKTSVTNEPVQNWTTKICWKQLTWQHLYQILKFATVAVNVRMAYSLKLKLSIHSQPNA